MADTHQAWPLRPLKYTNMERAEKVAHGANLTAKDIVIKLSIVHCLRMRYMFDATSDILYNWPSIDLHFCLSHQTHEASQ